MVKKSVSTISAASGCWHILFPHFNSIFCILDETIVMQPKFGHPAYLALSSAPFGEYHSLETSFAAANIF